MFLVLEIINPMYLLVACCCFMIVVGCACYGCYDIVSEKSLDAVAAGGVVACDMSDCEIPEIHEQHLEDKADGFWGKKAWGTDSETCPGGIFDLPIESTSIPEFPNDYVGGTYGDIGSGCSHSTIDRDFRPGIDDGKAEGSLKIQEDITIDIPNDMIAGSDQEVTTVADSLSSPVESVENTTDKNSEESSAADKFNTSDTDLEKPSESTEKTKLQLISESDTTEETNYAEKLDDLNVEKESCDTKTDDDKISLKQTICGAQEESALALNDSNEIVGE